MKNQKIKQIIEKAKIPTLAIITSLSVLGMGYFVGFNASNIEASKRLHSLQATYSQQLATYRTMATSQVVGLEGSITEDFHKDRGDTVIELTDGSWFLYNTSQGKYIFQPVAMGDWEYQVDSMEELNKIVNNYMEISRFIAEEKLAKISQN